MSANIYWEPLSKTSAELDVGGAQKFMGCLFQAGLGDLHNEGSVILGAEAIPTLKGMCAVYSGVNIQNPYWHLIQALEKHGSIRLWAQY